MKQKTEKKSIPSAFRLTGTAKNQLKKLHEITGKSQNQLVNESIGLAFETKKHEIKQMLGIKN